MSDEKNQDLGFEMFKALGEVMSSDKHSKRKALEIMRLADKTQPDAGWDTASGKLNHYYETHEIELDSP